MVYSMFLQPGLSVRAPVIARTASLFVTTLLAMQSIADDHTALVLDFAREENLSAYDWFHESDFELKEDADERDQ